MLDFGSAFLKKYCDLFNLSIRLLRTSAFNDLVAVTASVFLIISNNLVLHRWCVAAVDYSC